MGGNKTKGFTLIDIIVGMAVIAIAVVVTLEFYRFCMKQFIINARLSLEATDFARETMEGLYFSSAATSFDGIVTATDVLPSSIGGFPAELTESYYGTRNYTITPKTDYKIIETKVEWTR